MEEIARLLSQDSTPPDYGEVARYLANSSIPVPIPRPDIYEQAKLQYPILRRIDFNHTENKGVTDGRILESWPVGEGGDEQYPRPASLPIDKFGVEVFDPSTTAKDLAADVVSHGLVYSDPDLSPLYQEFENTFYTPEGLERLQRDYEWATLNEGEGRPLDIWAQNSRIPAYFRGYTFGQWPQEEYESMYSPNQTEILDKMSKIINGQ